MNLEDKLNRAARSPFPSSTGLTTPVWAGPESSTDKGGITVSLLSRFLQCRERFRLLVVEGLKPYDSFNHKLEFGNLWHACEEGLNSQRGWEDAMGKYASALCRRYPLAQEQILHWANVCAVQYPVYLDYWATNPDPVPRQPILREQVFSVPYRLPSGRTVYLRGKMDGVDMVESGAGEDRQGTARRGATWHGAASQVWLKEDKTKGSIYPEQLRRQLLFDLQTMVYLVALGEIHAKRRGELRDAVEGMGNPPILPTTWVQLVNAPIAGVRYNVVRRPLSGGKGSIVRHKPSKSNPQGESAEEFYARLGEIIRAEPETYFYRWDVYVTPEDVSRFRRQCLDPILEQLCDWWMWVTGEKRFPARGVEANYGLHWRHPYGTYSPLNEGGSTEYDAYLADGSVVGLERTTNLFPELQGG